MKWCAFFYRVVVLWGLFSEDVGEVKMSNTL